MDPALEAPHNTLTWLHQTFIGLVDSEPDVFIEASVSDRGTTFKVSVHPADIGKVIGKHGQHGRAIRALLFARGRKDGTVYALDLRERPRADLKPGGIEVFAR
jgi:predicted RNA-binding protein YlqC (UPF0109 family)